MPPPRNSHLARCFGVAFKSLGNHTKGTETVRPSSSKTPSMSSVHDTSTAKTSQSSAEITIPFLFRKFSPFRNNLLQLRQLVAAKAVIARQAHGLEPKLRVAAGMVYRNVRRLISLFAEEEEPVSANSQHRRHEDSVPREGSRAKDACGALFATPALGKPPAMP